MARLHNIIGTGRGRLGNAILSKGDNGQTIARAHQPQVRNPRTYAQCLQRAKMNLAGQFAKLVETEILSAMGMGNGRNNRSAFVSNILKKATASTDANDSSKYNAVIAGEDVKFSNGSFTKGGICRFPTIDSVAFRTVMDYIEEEFSENILYGNRFIIAGLTNGNSFDFVTYKDIVKSDDPLSVNICVPFPRSLTTGEKVMVWHVPFTFGTTINSMVGDNPAINENNITAALQSHSNTSGVEWGITKYIGTYTYTES